MVACGHDVELRCTFAEYHTFRLLCAQHGHRYGAHAAVHHLHGENHVGGGGRALYLRVEAPIVVSVHAVGDVSVIGFFREGIFGIDDDDTVACVDEAQLFQAGGSREIGHVGRRLAARDCRAERQNLACYGVIRQAVGNDSASVSIGRACYGSIIRADIEADRCARRGIDDCLMACARFQLAAVELQIDRPCREIGAANGNGGIGMGQSGADGISTCGVGFQAQIKYTALLAVDAVGVVRSLGKQFGRADGFQRQSLRDGERNGIVRASRLAVLEGEEHAHIQRGTVAAKHAVFLHGDAGDAAVNKSGQVTGIQYRHGNGSGGGPAVLHCDGYLRIVGVFRQSQRGERGEGGGRGEESVTVEGNDGVAPRRKLRRDKHIRRRYAALYEFASGIEHQQVVAARKAARYGGGELAPGL